MCELSKPILYIACNVVTATGLPFLLSFGAGYLSGSNKVPKSTWYKKLRKPPGNPPSFIFPIVWTCLYAGMGYSSYLAGMVYDGSLLGNTKERAASALKLYYLQLILNILWPVLFFAGKMKRLALVEIVVLLGVVITMTKQMNELDTTPNTSWFLIPYCAWLTYATYLNAGFVYLNRSGIVAKGA